MFILFKKMFTEKISVIFIAFLINGIYSINIVNDGDLINLLSKKENVIAFFTKSNCVQCEQLEGVLENIVTDLQESLEATIVKLYNSNMASKYDPFKQEPALIYFRRGLPLLYYGDYNEDEIYQTFSDNRDPIAKELSDDNFEHLTQASSGSTTGDWFVFFYSADCVQCQRMQAIWEAVGSKLRRQLNVARVNRLGAGISTAKRFGIKESPEFIYIRHGKFYRYKLKEYDPKNLIAFAENIKSNKSKGENVPPATPEMGDIMKSTMEILTKNPMFAYYGGIATFFAVLSAIIMKFCFAKQAKVEENKDKKAK